VYSGRLAGEAAASLLAGHAAAAADYADELRSVFGPALARALRRRQELAGSAQDGGASGRRAMRRGWIAFPEYWAA
jgi:hypothetical protein